MARRGVSVTGAVTRLSVLVPVAVSLAAWGERASALQGAGIGLAVLSLPLLSLGRSLGGDPRGASPAPRGRGAAVALLAGLFQQVLPSGQALVVLVGVSVAFLAAAAWIFSTREYVLEQ